MSTQGTLGTIGDTSHIAALVVAAIIVAMSVHAFFANPVCQPASDSYRMMFDSTVKGTLLPVLEMLLAVKVAVGVMQMVQEGMAKPKPIPPPGS